MAYPSTIQDWQLYSSKPGAGVAARALTAALSRAVTAMKRGMSPSAAYERFMVPVMSKHINFGATDTEPRNVALTALEKASGRRISGYAKGSAKKRPAKKAAKKSAKKSAKKAAKKAAKPTKVCQKVCRSAKGRFKACR